MNIGTVFVPAFDISGVEHAAKAALPFVKASNARLRFGHVKERFPTGHIAEHYWHESVVAKFKEDVRLRAEQLRAAATQSVGAHDYEWKEIDDFEEDAYGPMARAADLVVAPAPAQCGREDAARLLENLLVSCGRPVCIAPSGAEPKAIQSYLIGWNGSVEATRAIAAAHPLLTAAKKVLVVSVGEIDGSAPRAEDIAESLTRSGVAADGKTVQKNGSVTDTLTSEAAAAGLDALLLGAYSHSRLMERVLGGVTRRLVKDPSMPIVFVH
ncbi:MAG: hypothetical protein ACFB00_05805 [Parvularculaceae bacterium]